MPLLALAHPDSPITQPSLRRRASWLRRRSPKGATRPQARRQAPPPPPAPPTPLRPASAPQDGRAGGHGQHPAALRPRPPGLFHASYSWSPSQRRCSCGSGAVRVPPPRHDARIRRAETPLDLFACRDNPRIRRQSRQRADDVKFTRSPGPARPPAPPPTPQAPARPSSSAPSRPSPPRASPSSPSTGSARASPAGPASPQPTTPPLPPGSPTPSRSGAASAGSSGSTCWATPSAGTSRASTP